jgi:hypothetical protein
MNALVKFGVASVLVISALVSNLILALSILPSADAQVRGRPGQGLDWRTFEVPEFGTTVDYPAGIFSEPDGKAENGTGLRFNRGQYSEKNFAHGQDQFSLVSGKRTATSLAYSMCSTPLSCG